MADEEKVPIKQSPEEEAPIKVSRRDFLIGSGAGVIVTGAAAAGYIALSPPKQVEVVKEVPKEVVREVTKEAPAAGEAAPAVQAREVIAGPMLVSLRVNGRDYEVTVEPQSTLADVLRRDLGLTGTHIGCNGSYCSACTVLVDGVAENSCSLLAIRETGKEITTIEGLEVDGRLHPVQQAFWEQMGYQCGFCTSGQMMRAVELLNNVKNPTEEQILRHLSGNMCKCSAYPNILRAVQEAAKMMA
ncbi:MAG: (2Fe-2S)-binding protein [Ardenticatenaceae bacterium]|nr:(2Fe-2S)-binding protein [Ardenticatenaceae bacterium]